MRNIIIVNGRGGTGISEESTCEELALAGPHCLRLDTRDDGRIPHPSR